MKVNEVISNKSSLQGSAIKEDKKVSDIKAPSFQAQLKRVEEIDFEQRIRELVDKITEQGKQLGKKIDIRELKKYKSLISDFMDEAVDNSHKFSKKNFLDKRGRHKIYAVVKRVNEELESLTKDVLSDQKDNIGILKKIDDIRGLILDLSL